MTMLETEFERDARTNVQQGRVAGNSTDSSYNTMSRATSGPAFEPLDIVAAGLASFMLLAPLAVSGMGWGG